MSEVVLYQYPRAGRLESISPFCVKVQRALRYKQVEFRIENLALGYQIRRANPRGRLPAADIDQERVHDSSDILRALERRFPERPLFPTDPQTQAEALLLEDWADEVLYPYLLYWRWLIEPPDPQRAFKFLPRFLRGLGVRLYRRTVRRRLRYQGTGLKPAEVVRAELTRALRALDTKLRASATPYLLGTLAPTHADIAVFAQVNGLYWKPLPEARALVASHTALMDWYAAVDGLTRAATPAAGDGDS